MALVILSFAVTLNVSPILFVFVYFMLCILGSLWFIAGTWGGRYQMDRMRWEDDVL